MDVSAYLFYHFGYLVPIQVPIQPRAICMASGELPQSVSNIAPSRRIYCDVLGKIRRRTGDAAGTIASRLGLVFVIGVDLPLHSPIKLSASPYTFQLLKHLLVSRLKYSLLHSSHIVPNSSG